jgi:hypothetical protein
VVLRPEPAHLLSSNGNGVAANGREGKPKNGKFRIPVAAVQEQRVSL